jgi:hypothetical protein
VQAKPLAARFVVQIMAAASLRLPCETALDCRVKLDNAPVDRYVQRALKIYVGQFYENAGIVQKFKFALIAPSALLQGLPNGVVTAGLPHDKFCESAVLPVIAHTVFMNLS